ncbi:transposon-encoded TnpW family protein [Bengtsoniella intestinalis]|uniref:transposon-encoded TnpW family protein n=1 Tax=Bengtsoniella intestinalis TaxID=3073143 RepID=UPI00391EEFC2
MTLNERESAPVPHQPHFIKKVGNTTYHVNLHFSQTSTETLEDKIERFMMREVEEILKNDK